mgnify:CR=1 FL=1
MTKSSSDTGEEESPHAHEEESSKGGSDNSSELHSIIRLRNPSLMFNYSTLICSECRCECVVLVCISCAENQQCALEFTISSCKTRKYGNEKGKQKGGSKCSFFRVSFKVFLGSIKVATSRHKEEERRKKGGWVSISVVLFVLFVLHMFLLVGLGYCPFLDPIMYDA